MKTVLSFLLTLGAFGLLQQPAQAAVANWEIDPVHSVVGFKVRHLMVSNVAGKFTKFSGTIALDDADITKASVSVSIDAASINTEVAERDNHLRSPDFFDAAKFPSLTFRSTKVEKGATADAFKVTGDLTIHGVTKPVTLEVEKSQAVQDPWGNTRMGYSTRTRISRKDYGLTWNKTLEAGGVVVGDEVAIDLEVEAVKQKPGAEKK